MNSERTFGTLRNVLESVSRRLLKGRDAFVRIDLEANKSMAGVMLGITRTASIKNQLQFLSKEDLDENYVIAVLAGDETKGIDAVIICIGG